MTSILTPLTSTASLENNGQVARLESGRDPTVSDAAWHPRQPGVLASCTGSGHLDLWDLDDLISGISSGDASGSIGGNSGDASGEVSVTPMASIALDHISTTQSTQPTASTASTATAGWTRLAWSAHATPLLAVGATDGRVHLCDVAIKNR